MLLLSSSVAGGWVVEYLDLSEFGFVFIISEGRGLCLARGIELYIFAKWRSESEWVN